MEKKMENEMETGGISGLRLRVYGEVYRCVFWHFLGISCPSYASWMFRFWAMTARGRFRDFVP